LAAARRPLSTTSSIAATRYLTWRPVP